MRHCCKSYSAYFNVHFCSIADITQYFVTPVSVIHYRGKDLKMPMVRGNSGDYAAVLKSWLMNIMYGKEQHEWGVVIEEKEDL